MRWSPRGAHLLLRIRTNDDLADAFSHWYPGFTHTSEATLDDQQVAAWLPRFVPLPAHSRELGLPVT
jgi:hypothetical protein